MEQTYLSDYDRALIAGMTDAVRELTATIKSRDSEKVYSNKEAAKVLGRSEQTISRWIASGKVKKGERGGRTGIPQSEIDKIQRSSPQ